MVSGLRGAALVVAALCVPTLAKAGDPEKADELFKQGRAALEAGDYGRACPLLERSVAEDVAGGALVNLAFCQQMIGKHWLAYRAYSVALEQSPSGERRAFIERSLKQVLRKLPHVRLQVGPGAPPAVVLEDGTAVKNVDAPFPVEPGRRTLSLVTPGQPPRTVTFDAPDRPGTVAVIVAASSDPEGATPGVRSIAPAIDPVPPGSSPPGSPEGSSGRTARTVGFASMGVGVAAVGLGTFFGFQSLAIRDSACPSNACDRAGVDRIQGSATDTATLSTLGFAVGIAALAGGALLVLTNR